jgi:hypothetical protein
VSCAKHIVSRDPPALPSAVYSCEIDVVFQRRFSNGWCSESPRRGITSDLSKRWDSRLRRVRVAHDEGVVDPRERRSDRYRDSLLDENFRQSAIDRRWHLCVRLIGRDRHERLILPDDFARAHKPLR